MIRCNELTKIFKSGRRQKKIAVSNCNLSIERGMILGIAGNSGCGKSTLARMLAGLVEQSSGHIIYDGIKKKEVQLIFQHPEGALNPKMTIESSLLEPNSLNQRQAKEIALMKIKELFSLLSLSEGLLSRYPHQISGGEAQRICICRALLMNPKVLILDESTSMLDVSTQATIIEVLKLIKGKFDLTYIMISHDIELLQSVCDSVILMKDGEIIEQKSTVSGSIGFESDLGKDMIASFKYFYEESI